MKKKISIIAILTMILIIACISVFAMQITENETVEKITVEATNGIDMLGIKNSMNNTLTNYIDEVLGEESVFVDGKYTVISHEIDYNPSDLFVKYYYKTDDVVDYNNLTTENCSSYKYMMPVYVDGKLGAIATYSKGESMDSVMAKLENRDDLPVDVKNYIIEQAKLVENKWYVTSIAEIEEDDFITKSDAALLAGETYEKFMYVNVNGKDMVIVTNGDEKSFVTYGKDVEPDVYSVSEISSIAVAE